MELILDAESGATRTFSSIASFEEWLAREREYWEWLKEIRGEEPALAKQNINSALSIQTAVRNMPLADANKAQTQEALDTAVKHINTHIQRRAYFTSESLYAKHLDLHRELNPDAAAYALYLRSVAKSKTFARPSVLWFEAMALNSLYDTSGVRSTLDETNKTIEAIYSRIEGVAGNAQEKLHSIDERRSHSFLRFSRWVYSRRALLNREIKNTKRMAASQTAAIIESAREEIDSFRKSVENEISLQAPVSYWKKKRSAHKRATYMFAAVFLAYSGLLALAAVNLIVELDLSLEALPAFASELGVEGLSIIVLITAVSLIISRIIYRLFSSQPHLWNDASERVTMIQTYLALSVKENIKEQHLTALIQRLFAPASDGVVKDDFGTVGALDAAINRSFK